MADEGCQVIAAVYARLSKEDTRTAGDNGAARQLELGRGFVVKNGWTVNESYVLADAGVSGANFDHRPGLVRLLEGARQKPRPFDIVVVAAIDRIGREQVATSGVLKRLTRAGIQVWCYQDDPAQEGHGGPRHRPHRLWVPEREAGQPHRARDLRGAGCGGTPRLPARR